MESRSVTKREPAHPRAHVTSVNLSTVHSFSKEAQPVIRLLEGLGVEGDAHCSATVRHPSRFRSGSTVPNLRQVHLLHTELFEQLAQVGHPLRPGDLGENVSTTGVDLLSLPTDTLVRLGDEAEVRITGLRNPCRQIDSFRRGLLKHMLCVDPDGHVVRRAGVMAVVTRSGEVRAGDTLTVVLPPEPHRRLDRV